MPAGVHLKLLVAFVGTALLVVGVGLLGLRLLGQSNERVETLGTLQERAFAYGKLRSDALHVRLLLSENVAGDFYKSLGTDVGDGFAEAGGAGRLAVDRAIAHAVTEIPSSTFPDTSGVRASGRGRELPDQDPDDSRAALDGDATDHRFGP